MEDTKLVIVIQCEIAKKDAAVFIVCSLFLIENIALKTIPQIRI